MIVAFAVAGAMSLGGGRALASHVSCGDTITADTTLDSDLVDCPNNGIVIGADDVTLDLNGHLIDGDGTFFAGCPEGEPCDVGVLNDGHDGVTVRDGTVRQFGVGALVFSARHNRVLGISSPRNLDFGFVIADSARIVVRNSTANHNIAPEGDGIGLFGSHDIRILHSSFRHNAGPGLHAVDSPDNLIKGNQFARNAILMGDERPGSGANRNQVRRNRFFRGAGVIVAPGNRNVIARNRVSRGGNGIAIEKGRGNLVARNVVVGARRTGISLGLQRPLIGGGNNVVRRNLVRGSGGDGFQVNEKDGHSLLRRNIAIRAGGDGFDVESRSTRLAGNRAVRNADLGIEAVAGVFDGGGNTAGHNGDSRQCTQIVCS